MSILATAPNSTRHFDMNIAEALESVEAAIILQQLHYWTNKEGIGEIIEGKKFIYNTFREWVNTQFKWLTNWKFRQAMNILRNLSIVEVIRYRSRQWNQTNYYNLNYQRLKEWAKAESIEIAEMWDTSPQDKNQQTLEKKNPNISNKETKNTLQKRTTKLNTAAPSKKQLKNKNPIKQHKLPKQDPNPQKEQINPKSADKTTTPPQINNTTQIKLLKRAEIPINKTILNLLKEYPAEETRQAIALLQARRKEKYISNPAGYFIAALKGNWGKAATSRQDSNTFQHWYELAKELGYCSRQEARDGEQWVYLSGYWEKWSEATERGYSLEYLRKIKKRNRRK